MRLTLRTKQLRSEAGQDLVVELVLRCCSGPTRLSLRPATVSQTGESGMSLSRVHHERDEARGHCRAVVTPPQLTVRLRVTVIEVLPHRWFRQPQHVVRDSPCKASVACEAVFLCESSQGCVPCHDLLLFRRRQFVDGCIHHRRQTRRYQGAAPS